MCIRDRDMAMRKKICIALMTAFTVLLGVSSYFIIDHYRAAEHQAVSYTHLAFYEQRGIQP